MLIPGYVRLKFIYILKLRFNSSINRKGVSIVTSIWDLFLIVF